MSTTPTLPARYFAELTWQDGSSAHAEDRNLRRLIQRIRRNFAGETTDWGFTASQPLKAWSVRDRRDERFGVVADWEAQ